MATVNGSGTQLFRGDGASPEVFAQVTQTTGITPLGKTRSLIDITNHASTVREYSVAIPDGSELQVEVQYDPDDLQQTGCFTDLSNGVARNFRIDMADSPSTQWSFTALVTRWELGFPIDNVVPLTMTLKVTGNGPTKA